MQTFIASDAFDVLNEASYIHHDIDTGCFTTNEMNARLNRLVEATAFVANRAIDAEIRRSMYRLICGADQLRSSLATHASSEPDWNSMNRFMDDIVHLDELLSR